MLVLLRRQDSGWQLLYQSTSLGAEIDALVDDDHFVFAKLLANAVDETCDDRDAKR
jgi:hypothetical protein